MAQHVPERVELEVDVPSQWVVASRDGVEELDAHARQRRRQRADGAVPTQGECRVQQRIDAAQNHVLGLRIQQQVGQRLEVARALLDADHARNAVHDGQHVPGRQVVPGNDVVDEDRRPGLLPDRAEVGDRRFQLRLEEVVDRRDLQCRDVESLEQLESFDGLLGRIDDQADDERHAAGDGVMGDLHRCGELVAGQGVPFAGGTARHDGAHAVGDHQVDLRPEPAGNEISFLVERHGDRRQDTGESACALTGRSRWSFLSTLPFRWRRRPLDCTCVDLQSVTLSRYTGRRPILWAPRSPCQWRHVRSLRRLPGRPQPADRIDSRADRIDQVGLALGRQQPADRAYAQCPQPECPVFCPQYPLSQQA